MRRTPVPILADERLAGGLALLVYAGAIVASLVQLARLPVGP